MIEKVEFKNKEKVKQLREKFSHNQIGFQDMPKDVLVELLTLAIQRIDDLDNGGEFDERDWKDCLCDKEFIVDDLFAELEDLIKLGIYK